MLENYYIKIRGSKYEKNIIVEFCIVNYFNF